MTDRMVARSSERPRAEICGGELCRSAVSGSQVTTPINSIVSMLEYQILTNYHMSHSSNLEYTAWMFCLKIKASAYDKALL